MLVIGFSKLLWAVHIIIMKSLTFFNIQIFQNFHLCFWFSKLFFNFSFSSLIFADFFFSINSASANNSAIFSFSFKAMSFFDYLFDEELDDDFLLTDFFETSIPEKLMLFASWLLFFQALHLSSSYGFCSWMIACLHQHNQTIPPGPYPAWLLYQLTSMSAQESVPEKTKH